MTMLKSHITKVELNAKWINHKIYRTIKLLERFICLFYSIHVLSRVEEYSMLLVLRVDSPMVKETGDFFLDKIQNEDMLYYDEEAEVREKSEN